MDKDIHDLETEVAAKSAEIKEQQAEIDALKKEVERLRSSWSVVVAPPLVPFRFLDLPAELRESIYELCVVKGTILLTPITDYDHRYNNVDFFENPEWQLLAVNRQIRSEAAITLLSKNHFILSYDNSSYERFWVPNPNIWGQTALGLPTLASHHLRSISFPLDIRTISDDVIAIASYARPDESDVSIIISNDNNMDPHIELARNLDVWYGMCRALMKAKFVQIDITNIYCPMGCHRYVDEAAEAIKQALRESVPTTLEILGARDMEERYMIERAIREGLSDMRGYEERGGVLQFKSSGCPRTCSRLHEIDFQDVPEDHLITFKSIIASGEKDCSRRDVKFDSHQNW